MLSLSGRTATVPPGLSIASDDRLERPSRYGRGQCHNRWMENKTFEIGKRSGKNRLM